LAKGLALKHNQAQAAASRETSVADNRVEANWILKAMVAVASSDHQLDAREIGLIQTIYRDRTGRTLNEEEIARTALANSKANLLGEFSEAGKFLDQGTKEEIVRSAYLVLLADNRIAGEERKKLQDISAALRIPEIHFGAILEDLAVWLAGQKI
jgi:tellurite resistance protein